MTIALSANTPRISYTVNEGVTRTSPFPTGFVFFESSDINVFVDGVARTFDSTTSNTTQFTVSGGNGSTGSVTTTVTGATGGSTVIITRDVEVKRIADFPSSGAFEISKLNTELDTIVTMIADADDENTRALRLKNNDDAVDLTLPLKANRVGTVLGFNATTGAAEAGPTITAVQSLADVTTSINLLGTTDAVADMNLLATTANVTAMGHLGTSANVTAMGHLGTSANVTAMGHLGTSSNVTNMASLGTSANVTNMATLTASGVIANIATVAGINTEISNVSGVSTNVQLLGTSDAVADMNTLAAISSDITSLANSLEKTYTVTVANPGSGNVFVLDSANAPAIEMFRGNTYIFNQTDASNDGHPLVFKNGSSAYEVGVTYFLNGSATTQSNYVNTTTFNAGRSSGDRKVQIEVATTAPSSGLRYYCYVHGNGMGNTITVKDSNISLVAGNIANVNLVGGDITNVNNVAGSLTNIGTVASNLAGVNSFGERYRIASSAPTSSLDVGDLYFDTTQNELKVYKSSGWAAAGSSVNGTSERFTYNITGTPTTLTGASGTGFAEAGGKTLAYDAGFIDVYLNGVKMVNGTDVTVTSGSSVVFASALSNGDVVDIVTFGTFSLANIVSTGALNSGSITSGFGNINTGSSTITTTGAITGGSLVADNITIDGTEIDLSSGDLTIDVASNINLDADGGTISLQDDGTEVGRLILNSNGGDLIVSSRVQDKDIVFTGNDGGVQTEFVRIDMSNDGETTITNKNGGSGLVLHRDFSGSNVTSNTNTGHLEFQLSDSGVSNQTIAKISPQATVGTGNALGGVMRFMTSNTSGTETEAMRIENDGQLSVGGTGAGTAKIYALRDTAGATVFVQSSSNATSGIKALQTSINQNAGNTNCQHLRATTQNVGTFRLDGNGASTFTSDERLKKNIETARDGYLDDIAKLRVVRYNWHCHDEDDKKELGLIAQEVQKVFPKLVVQDDEELNGIKDPLAVKLSVLPMLLLKALQEANTKITALETENKTQATQIADLITRVTALENK